MDTLPPAPLPLSLSLSLSLSLCLSLSSRHATRPCSAFTGVTLAAGDRPPLTRSTRNSALPTCRAAEHSRTLAFAVSIRRRSEVDRQRERERERERERLPPGVRRIDSLRARGTGLIVLRPWILPRIPRIVTRAAIKSAISRRLVSLRCSVAFRRKERTRRLLQRGRADTRTDERY